MVNGFLHRYDLVGNPGSYREDLGVLPTDEAVFGALSTAALLDGKLPIFVIDTNGGGAGYLCGWCSGVELHLDGTDLTPLDGDGAVSIAAHETFHAIHRGYDANEVGWLDETLAQAAMVANGFFSTDRALLNQFARKPNVNWGPGLSDTRKFDYGAGLAFGAYLWELGGPELMQAVTQNPANAWAGLDAALQATGYGESGLDTLLDMAVALWLDDPERGYGFESFDLVDGVGTTALDADVNGVVEPYALAYFAIGDGGHRVARRGRGHPACAHRHRRRPGAVRRGRARRRHTRARGRAARADPHRGQHHARRLRRGAALSFCLGFRCCLRLDRWKRHPVY